MNERELIDVFGGKSVLVTGGTGSFGHQIVRELSRLGPARISIYSRDEKKQYEMAMSFRRYKNLQFNIGDVRDLERTRDAMRGIDIVFHAAALKQVPNCEYAPFEAVATNIIGANNVRRAAIETGVQVVASISTDKAVKPVNVMGMTKAIQERIMLDPTFGDGNTKFVCVRYGNVLGSRGSVVPLFFDYIQKGLPLPITHPDMTRFQLTLKEAVQLVLWATVRGESGDLWVQKMPTARITDLGQTLAHGLTGKRDYPVTIIGMRPGEKLHEVLVSEEEMWRATELERHYVIPSWAKSQDKKTPENLQVSEYSSAGAHQLTQEELHAMLESDGWFGPDAKAKAMHGVEINEE
ncbi:MAG: polysaccharide biosynthesis protein [candidate division WOR-3 bacterium]|nr:polysaccharide biosynthesis protein [candidate division WOR-3 bacterium]